MADVEDRLVVRMEATLARFERQMKRGQEAATKGATGAQRAWDRSGKRIQQSGVRAASGLTRILSISGRGRFVLQNTAAQFGDIAVQMESGTAASRVLGQQLPQLLGGFGALGGALGVLAPLLGTVAAVGIPLAAMMLTVGDNAEDAAAEVETFEDALSNVKSAMDRVQQSLTMAASGGFDNLQQQYGSLTEAIKNLSLALRDVELRALAVETGGLARTFAENGGLEQGILAQGQRLRDYVGELQRLEAEQARIQQMLQSGSDASILENYGSKGALFERSDEIVEQINQLRASIPDIQAFADSLQISRQQAQELVGALAAVNSASGPEEMTAAYGRAADVLSGIRGALQDAGVDVREGVYAEMTRLEDQLRQNVRVLEESADAADRLASAAEDGTVALDGSFMAAERLRGAIEVALGGLAGLVSGAASLWENMSGAASAAWDYAAGVAAREAVEAGAVGPDAAVESVRAGFAGQATTRAAGIREESVVSRRTISARPSQGVSSRGGRGRSGGGGSGRSGAGGSGRGGAAAVDPMEGFFDSARDDIRSLERRIELIGQTSQETARLETQWQLLDEARERGIDLDARTADGTRTVREEIAAQASSVGVLTDQLERAEISQQKFQDRVENVADALANAIVNADDFGEAIGNMLRQIAADQLSQGFQGVFGSLFGGAKGSGGGGFLSAIFDGFRASGGPVSPGRAYVVGERGPELIIPKAPGIVIPNGGTVGGGGSIQIAATEQTLTLSDDGQIMARMRVMAKQAENNAMAGVQKTLANQPKSSSGLG